MRLPRFQLQLRRFKKQLEGAPAAPVGGGYGFFVQNTKLPVPQGDIRIAAQIGDRPCAEGSEFILGAFDGQTDPPRLGSQLE